MPVSRPSMGAKGETPITPPPSPFSYAQSITPRAPLLIQYSVPVAGSTVSADGSFTVVPAVFNVPPPEPFRLAYLIDAPLELAQKIFPSAGSSTMPTGAEIGAPRVVSCPPPAP